MRVLGEKTTGGGAKRPPPSLYRVKKEYSSKRRAAPLRLRNIYGQPKSGGRGVVKN